MAGAGEDCGESVSDVGVGVTVGDVGSECVCCD